MDSIRLGYTDQFWTLLQPWIREGTVHHFFVAHILLAPSSPLIFAVCNLGKKALLLQFYAEPFKVVQMTETFLCDYMVVPRMVVISTLVHGHSARIDAVTQSHFSFTFWEHICFHFELVWGIFFEHIKKVNNISFIFCVSVITQS